ncbi:MAG: site-2 protease family protein [Thermofilaceae archaeon]|nr:site-2 protease family protein [Thermofilaceae archaeon]
MLEAPSITVLIACFLVYLYVVWKGLKGDSRISFYGPVALIRCRSCVEIIQKIARLGLPHAAWLAVGTWIFSMLFGMVLLLQSALGSFALSPEQAPEPTTLIGLPGINPLIPLSYGLMGLVTAIFAHELAHGVTLVANGLAVKSAGIVYFGLPLGAFVEPSDEFQNAKTLVKTKTFSSGPFANFLIAFLTLLILSSLSTNVSPTVQGIVVTYVAPETPAAQAGIKPGDIIVGINNHSIRNGSDFHAFMKEKRAGENVVLHFHDGRRVTVTLADRYYFTKNDSERGMGFIGVRIFDVDELSRNLMFSISDKPIDSLRKIISFPLYMETMKYLEAALPQPFGDWELFYTLAWIAWMNLALGLTNSLPIVPFDGGSALKVVLETTLNRIPESRRSSIVNVFTLAVSLATIALILAPILVPRLKFLFHN